MGEAMTHAIRIPHETEFQSAIHTCWPAAANLWEEDLIPAQEEFARFLWAVSEPSEDDHGLPLVIYAATDQAETSAREAMGRRAEIVRANYGDVWLRDTGPVFGIENGRLVAVRFEFNGWGGKYDLAGDRTIGRDVVDQTGAEERRIDLVCEGGALEFDGQGSVITTRQCLLNPNRNPGLSEAEVEARLKAGLGLEAVIWLDEGLAGDHTDGHVDNIARFIRPGVVACQAPNGTDDPNAKVLDAIARQLEKARDAQGRRLEVVRIPSPGFVDDGEGGPAAASHMNWVVGADAIVVPSYNDNGEAAAKALEEAFGRRAVACSANHILTGGGAFHCVTCNQPSAD